MSRKKEDAVISPNEAEAHMIVKAMRIYLGMTQPEVAKKVGISASTYSSYEITTYTKTQHVRIYYVMLGFSI